MTPSDQEGRVRHTVDVTLRIDADNLGRLVREGDCVSMVWLEFNPPFGVYELCARRPDDMTRQEWNEGWVNDGSNPQPPLSRALDETGAA